MSLLQYLIKKGVLNKEEAARVRTEVKETMFPEEEIILRKKLVPEEDLFRLKSEFLKIPLREQIPDKLAVELLDLIPRESVKYYKMIPLSRTGNVLDVGMVYPENTQAQEAIKFLARQQKLSYRVFLITLANFRKCLASYGAPEKEVEKALRRLESEIKKEKKEVAPERVELESLIEEAPVIKMVAVILREAVEGRASDIHIEPTRKNLRVRYRLDGILHSSLLLPLKVHPAVVSRIKILSGLKIDETRLPQDGRFSTKIEGKSVDFRISTFPTILGEKVVVRILDPEEGLKPLSELGLRTRDLRIVEEAIKRPYGLILATGPTGCGKTTTLYSILRILNKEGVNIISLEDPVEYYLDGVSQSQVRPEIGYTFAKGLRQILRQDPDIIMVGEIRDEETAGLAVHAALTGHLVLSTLHTTGAIGVIARLIDMAVKPFLVSATLSLALSQRLARRLCPFCKKKIRVEGKTKRFILDKLKTLPPSFKKKVNLNKPFNIFKAVGCKKCNNKGYQGRIGIFEILKNTPELSKIIASQPSEQAILQEARAQEMLTMEEDGILKVIEGETTLEEVMRVAEEK